MTDEVLLRREADTEVFFSRPGQCIPTTATEALEESLAKGEKAIERLENAVRHLLDVLRKMGIPEADLPRLP